MDPVTIVSATQELVAVIVIAGLALLTMVVALCMVLKLRLSMPKSRGGIAAYPRYDAPVSTSWSKTQAWAADKPDEIVTAATLNLAAEALHRRITRETECERALLEQEITSLRRVILSHEEAHGDDESASEGLKKLREQLVRLMRQVEEATLNSSDEHILQVLKTGLTSALMKFNVEPSSDAPTDLFSEPLMDEKLPFDYPS